MKLAIKYSAIETYYLMQSSSKGVFVAGEILSVFIAQQRENE